MRWTRRCQAGFPPDETLAAYGEIVWSWRRDPGVYPARLCGLGNGDNKGRSPGRVRISRKTIARGRPGCLGCTCQTRVHSTTTSAHGDAGAVGARPSLRPFFEEGQRDCTTRAKTSRGNANAYPHRCLKNRICKLAVVPAKAGTHTPRRKLVCAMLAGFPSTTTPCGWAPACAGATC
jgi:hypothetical protein